MFCVETRCVDALLFTRNFEQSNCVSAPNDMSISDGRLSVFDLTHLGEPLLTPTLEKLFSQWQRVEGLHTIFSCMLIDLYCQNTF